MAKKKWMVAVAVANWENTQLEVNIWFRKMGEEKVDKFIHDILRKTYLRVVAGEQNFDFRKAEIRMGWNEITDNEIPEDKAQRIQYQFAKGRFMDEERKSYFWHEEMLDEGELLLEDLKKA